MFNLEGSANTSELRVRSPKDNSGRALRGAGS
jgi:hypothetical protein